MSWFWAILAAFAVSTAALAGSGLILLTRARAERAATWLLAFAIGTLLGAACLGLLPEALHHTPADQVMPLFLAGIVGFTLLERALRWRHPHAHTHHEPVPGHAELDPATAKMLLAGDAVHNFLDGIVLGVAFGIDVEVGLAAAVAVFAHEVPQEIGDFAVLLETGMPTRRAVWLNYLSAAAVIPGTIVAFAVSSSAHALVEVLVPLAAGGFVYIALANLVPALHHRRGAAAGVIQGGLILAGVLLMWVLGRLEPAG